MTQLIADVAKHRGKPYTNKYEDIYRDDNEDPIYPPHNGADYPEELIILPKGTRLERYGNALKGRFFANPEIKPETLALPEGQEKNGPHRFVVLQDLPVKAARVLPWFDKPGGAIQYRTANTASKMPLMIKELKK